MEQTILFNGAAVCRLERKRLLANSNVTADGFIPSRRAREETA
jgi:hypothetical protein